MYDLPYFKENDKETVLAFMRQHPFIFLSGVDENNKPVASQVPVFIDEKDGKLYLTGHIMKNTDHHKAFQKNSNVLAVFTGPHTYVSATWYDDPHQASTWNYMSVHVKGNISFGNYNDLVAILKRLTLYYENNNTASTTVFDNLPSEYTEKLMKAIVAFEVEVSSIENVFKLSQNRNEKSYQNIIEKLKGQNSDGKFIAEEMEKRQQQLFGK
jgi:transcriptional regulator